jgi:hypothetical protein
MHFHQGCQMLNFQTKNSNLGKFRRAPKWNMLDYFMAIWNTYLDSLVYVIAIW